MMRAGIAPCPFPPCGSRAVRAVEIARDRYAVACPACEAIGPGADTEAAAVAKWNAANAPDGAVMAEGAAP